MERLKTLDEIFTPDERSECTDVVNYVVNTSRKFGIEDHYNEIKRLNLDNNVPELIHNDFNTARNLLLYSWYVYPFMVKAELLALSCLELGLRTKIGDIKRPTLRSYMNIAIKKGLLNDNGLRDVSRIQEGGDEILEAFGFITTTPIRSGDEQGYVRGLAEALPAIRNRLAHGAPFLWPINYTTFNIVARLLNQLWGA